MQTLWSQKWLLMLHLLRVGTGILPLNAVSGYILQSVQIADKIDCFFRNAVDGKLYVKTNGSVSILDSSMQRLTALPVKKFWEENLFAPASLNLEYGCLQDEKASPRTTTSHTDHPNGLPKIRNNSGPWSCPEDIWDNITYSFVTSRTSFRIVRSKTRGSEIWYRNSTKSCYWEFLRTVNCNTKTNEEDTIIEFSEIRSVLYSEKGKSSSLFMLFTAPRELSIVCEYQWESGNTDVKESWKRSATSQIFTSTARQLYKTDFDGMEILLVLEHNQIKMIWLPLLNNSIEPQAILDRHFGRNDDTIVNSDTTPLITDMAVKGNASHIYVSTRSMIALVSLDNCTRCTNCMECLRSGGSHCGWCPTTKRCSFKQFCKLDKSDSTLTRSRSAWIDSLTNNDDLCADIVVPGAPLPHKRKPTGGSPHRSKTLRYLRSTAPSMVVVASRPPRSVGLISTEKQVALTALDVALWAVAAIVVILFLTTLVYLVRYLEIRKANRKLIKRLQDKYPQCRGMKSCKRIRETLREEAALAQERQCIVQYAIFERGDG
ncbi:uncharacterized protein LOC129586528 isoform X2 [Paramacrobiotus metropolitanus]|uniref:uncharacterized protein LOC129586528 isoform X2 n=1 Tax=Paramacrobiotus metropolitanus TaxID=2943436 RepID=UPI002445CE8B|nr:uncharacterized protein LOC129586528 isoform X2 [Paramacrobiotus metropolitanus]